MAIGAKVAIERWIRVCRYDRGCNLTHNVHKYTTQKLTASCKLQLSFQKYVCCIKEHIEMTAHTKKANSQELLFVTLDQTEQLPRHLTPKFTGTVYISIHHRDRHLQHLIFILRCVSSTVFFGNTLALVQMTDVDQTHTFTKYTAYPSGNCDFFFRAT
jgi:hypothetical protein